MSVPLFTTPIRAKFYPLLTISYNSGSGLPERRTHDYQRHGTTTLFAALNVLEGTVTGKWQRRHRHREFLRFLERIDQSV